MPRRPSYEEGRWPLVFYCTSVVIGMLFIVLLLAGCGDERQGVDVSNEVGAQRLGGDTSVLNDSDNAFTFPAPNLNTMLQSDFALGNDFFNRNWVTAPASVTSSDGLGPMFNATSCSACHFKDGRGAPPQQPDDSFLGLLLRLSVPGTDAHGAPIEEPNYGGQFNHQAILDVPAEGHAQVSYDEVSGTYADGEPFSLRKPTYHFSELAFGAMNAEVLVSPRVAPTMIGLGLLEAVSEERVLSVADEMDANGDGISGRANRVWNVKTQRIELGRFGWKANQPTLEQQVAGAFIGDIGITSSLFTTQNCTTVQTACAMAPSGATDADNELSDVLLSAVVNYNHTLAVPMRRNVSDSAVMRGAELFSEIGCAACHLPKMTTDFLDGFDALSHQTIRPFTDLLLHDMGEGLADGRPDFLADGREWRTPPLWGIGLVQTVNKHTFFLHDGRARNLSEAILWHGGEAQASKEAFRTLSAKDREVMLKFLESL